MEPYCVFLIMGLGLISIFHRRLDLDEHRSAEKPSFGRCIIEHGLFASFAFAFDCGGFGMGTDVIRNSVRAVGGEFQIMFRLAGAVGKPIHVSHSTWA